MSARPPCGLTLMEGIDAFETGVDLVQGYLCGRPGHDGSRRDRDLRTAAAAAGRGCSLRELRGGNQCIALSLAFEAGTAGRYQEFYADVEWSAA